jgi:hypothetical protein
MGSIVEGEDIQRCASGVTAWLVDDFSIHLLKFVIIVKKLQKSTTL